MASLPRHSLHDSRDTPGETARASSPEPRLRRPDPHRHVRLSDPLVELNTRLRVPSQRARDGVQHDLPHAMQGNLMHLYTGLI
jgi:hypothetical protein